MENERRTLKNYLDGELGSIKGKIFRTEAFTYYAERLLSMIDTKDVWAVLDKYDEMGYLYPQRSFNLSRDLTLQNATEMR